MQVFDDKNIACNDSKQWTNMAYDDYGGVNYRDPNQLDYRDFYGKYWGYTARQWRNLGLQFVSGTTYLQPEYVLDALKANNGQLGYIMLFVQISILQTEIHKQNTLLLSGVVPEILYDRWTWKSMRLSASIYDKDGSIKPRVGETPQTHIFNLYRKWMKQLVHDMYNHIGRSEHRTQEINARMIHCAPDKLALWLDQFPENWIGDWVFDPDGLIAEDDSVDNVEP